MLEDLELKIDFSFDHLIDRRDDDVEKRELNNIPYRQALRIDKRSFLEILWSVLTNQIELISLFLYRNPYSHYTLTVSIYIFELLLDLTMNCLYIQMRLFQKNIIMMVIYLCSLLYHYLLYLILFHLLLYF